MKKAAGKKRVVKMESVPTQDIPEPVPDPVVVARLTSGSDDEEIAVCIAALKDITVSGKDKAALDDLMARLRAMRGS